MPAAPLMLTLGYGVDALHQSLPARLLPRCWHIKLCQTAYAGSNNGSGMKALIVLLFRERICGVLLYLVVRFAGGWLLLKKWF